MSQKFRLTELNTKLGLKDGFYQNVDNIYRDSLMSATEEDTVLSFFSNSSDKGLFAIDYSRNTNDGSMPQILSAKPFNFMQAFNLSNTQTVLDISEDTGGIAHYVADHVAQVESIKLDPALTRLAVNRCSNKHNVAHISEDLDLLEFPDKYYDLIILGQLEALKLSQTQLKAFLSKLQKSLSDSGVMILNVENKNRLNRWFNPHCNGSQEKHAPFSDLYKFDNEKNYCTSLSRKELRDTILNAGLSQHEFHSTFSNGKQYDQLISENYLTSCVNADNHFYYSNCIDNPDVNEYLLLNSLIQKNQNVNDSASRYLAVLANSKSSIDSFYNDDFCYFGDLSLKNKYQTVLNRPHSSQLVERRLSHSTLANSNLINLNLDSEHYRKGPILAGEWLHAVLQNDEQAFTELVQEYIDFVASESQNDKFEDRAYNLLPSNIILNARGPRTYHVANVKWQLCETVNIDFVIFKALLSFIEDNFSIIQAYAGNNNIASVALFIVQYGSNFFQLEDLTPHIEMEEQLRSEVIKDYTAGTVKAFLDTVFNGHGNDSHETLISKRHKKSKSGDAKNQQIISAQLQQLSQYRQNTANLKQQIIDLREHRTEVVEKLKELKVQTHETQSRLKAEIDHLHERLHAQHVRNDELHGYLLMRPSTRAKRVARRTVNRLTGKPVIEHQEPEVETSVNDEETPLPLGELLGQNTEDYDLWISENSLSDDDISAAKKEINNMAYKPVFSILVPIYNTDPEYLLPMIQSVQNQIYPHWQLCLVDDCSPKTYLKRILEHEALQDERISIQLNDVNQGISVTTNDALAMAKGDFIALLDHDDEISIDALYENAKVINKYSDVGLIYSDEDKMEMDGTRLEPYFKPDFSPDLLHTNNYICHFTIIKTSIARDIGGFREGLDGSQDHDIIIRAAAKAQRVVHIPKILYHWRKIPGSTAVEYDSKSYAWEAGRKAVEDQLQKQEDGVRVEFGSLKGTYRVHREIKNNPLVSIIIPFKDKPELLDSCLNSILNRSSYQNFEIIGVSNNSSEELTFARMAHFAEQDQRITFVEKNIPFNFSAICNFGVDQANGEYVILLNNDIEIISPDWIEQMLQHAQRPEIGAVGGKLLYPDGRIQHAGVVAGMVGAAGHPHKFFPDNHIGYHGRLHMVYNVSAITGAMMMMKTQKFKDVGGFDDENLAVAYNDIDLCLKLIKQGYYNLFTPHAKATHHESISRGYEDTDEKLQRLLKEQKHFLTTWADFLDQGDPFYNPNLSLKNERFSLNFKD